MTTRTVKMRPLLVGQAQTAISAAEGVTALIRDGITSGEMSPERVESMALRAASTVRALLVLMRECRDA